MTGPRHSPTHKGERNDIENPAGESPADWHRPPGADRLHIGPDIGGGGIASPADPSGVGAGLVPAPIRAGGKLGHAYYLRWVKACLVLCSCPILRREPTFSRCRATGLISARQQPFSSLSGRRPISMSNRCAAGRAQAATASSATLSTY